MKTTFVFDTIISSDGNDFYTRTLHYELWKDRYLPYFGELTVVTRVKFEDKFSIDNNAMLQIVNGEKVFVNPINDYKKVSDSLFSYFRIKEEMRTIIEQSDFVIIRMPSILGFFAIKECKNLSKDYLVELVADPWDGYYYHTKKSGKILAPFMYIKTKKIVSKSNNVLYVTRDFLQKRYPSKGKHTIGVSDAVIDSPNESFVMSNINRRVLNIQNGNIRFGLVGNYDLRTKGQDIAIKAIHKSNLNKDNLKLELVGSGNSNYLENIIKEYNCSKNVLFIGTKKAGNEMFEWMDSLDVLLIPSYQEGLPRVVLEAMSRGLLVIGSSAGGIYKLISKEFIFKKGEVEDLRQLLNNLSNKKLSDEMILNYVNSFEYNKENLDLIRNKFYTDILKDKI